MAGVDWTESTMDAAGTKLHVARAGRGRPLVVLHHETGTLDRLPFYDALAAHYDVLVPHHPGYSRSQRPDWMRNTRDIAVIYRGLLSELKVGNVAMVGLGSARSRSRGGSRSLGSSSRRPGSRSAN